MLTSKHTSQKLKFNEQNTVFTTILTILKLFYSKYLGATVDQICHQNFGKQIKYTYSQMAKMLFFFVETDTNWP